MNDFVYLLSILFVPAEKKKNTGEIVLYPDESYICTVVISNYNRGNVEIT